MNLIIDIGNSRTKLAVFEDVTLKERTICSSNEIEKKIKERNSIPEVLNYFSYYREVRCDEKF